jgi:hypothetical protein
MASTTDNSTLWSCYMGKRWLLGLSHPNLYAQLHQAVVEIITNETAKALNILAKQQTKVCNTIYQNHLALDYLLASEGGICRKFNLSNCCLQIDDEGKVIKEITDKQRKKKKTCPGPCTDLEGMESQ